MRVLLDHCLRAGVIPLTSCEAYISAFDTTKHSEVVEFTTNRFEYWDSSLGLAGTHQVENACVAVMVAETLRIAFSMAVDEEAVWEGIENARHPGRLEYDGRYLFDGAHNLGGAKALANFIFDHEKRPITMIFGSMSDKNVSEILAVLAPLADKIVLTEPSNSRSLSYNELLEHLPGSFSRERTFASDSVEHAIDIAQTVSPNDGIILVTGSLYLVGEVKKQLSAIS